MILTKGTGCTSVVVASTLITTYVATPSNYTSIVLNIKKNCCDPIFTINLTGIVTSTYTLTPALYGLTGTTFDDGVYSFEIVLTTTGLVKTMDKNCTFINCKTVCDIGAYLTDNKNPWVYYYYQFLISGEQCNDCDCFYMCKLYKNLIEILGTSSTTSNCTSC